MDDGCRCEAIAKRERESESEMERWCRTDDLCSYWMYWCFLRGSPKSSKSLDNFRIESHGFGMFWGSPKLNFPYGHGSMIILDHPDAAGEIPVDGEELKRRCADSGVDAQTETIWEVLCGSRWGIFRGLTCLTDDLMDYIWLYEYYAVNLSPIPKMGRWWQRYPSLCKVVAVITVLLAWLKVGALCFQESSCHFFLRTFQEPKLRYLPYVGSMSGDMPQEYGFI